MKYRVITNAVGSWSIIEDGHKYYEPFAYVIATAYKEGIANRICSLLNGDEVNRGQ